MRQETDTTCTECLEPFRYVRVGRHKYTCSDECTIARHMRQRREWRLVTRNGNCSECTAPFSFSGPGRMRLTCSDACSIVRAKRVKGTRHKHVCGFCGEVGHKSPTCGRYRRD